MTVNVKDKEREAVLAEVAQVLRERGFDWVQIHAGFYDEETETSEHFRHGSGDWNTRYGALVQYLKRVDAYETEEYKIQCRKEMEEPRDANL